MKKIERTLVILKPDCIIKGMVGNILAKIEALGMRIVRAESKIISINECKILYANTRSKLPAIYQVVEEVITEGISIILIVEGENAVRQVYKLRGPTNLLRAKRGTIRRDFISDEERELFRKGKNVKNRMHASRTKKEAEAETRLFFH